MHTTPQRRQERDASEWRIEDRFSHYQNVLTDIVEKASRQAVEYAQQFENSVLVMENLTDVRERLGYGKYMNRRLHSWAFARLHGRIEDKATEAGIPVEYVNSAYTSQTCHSCSRLGRGDSQAEFRCPNDDCHVSTFQADITAFANIERRIDPWGESVPLDKAERDDSPRDESGCDTATTPSETASLSRGHERRVASFERHREKSVPAQMTVMAFRESDPTASVHETEGPVQLTRTEGSGDDD